MRAFRRAVVAMGLAAIGGIIIRVRGSSGQPAPTGTWRALESGELE